MNHDWTRSIVIALSLCVCILPHPAFSIETPSPTSSPFPDSATLNAVAWVQTSAEYTGLAIGAFHLAQERLTEALANPDRSWSAAVEQPTPDTALPPVVIVDLDETLLDNSAFEAQVIIDQVRRVHMQRKEFVDLGGSRLVPGALDFIRSTLNAGVRIVAITNRRLPEKDHTLANLIALGIPADDPARFEVMFRNDSVGWTRDKTSRRAEVARTHRIVLMIGDQIGDFISAEGLDNARERELARTHAARWGVHWILLPNPIYGDWSRDARTLIRGYK